MWTLLHFNEPFNCNGTIEQNLQALQHVQSAVQNQEPFINGNRASLHDTPPAGATVTFRPRMSGKA